MPFVSVVLVLLLLLLLVVVLLLLPSVGCAVKLCLNNCPFLKCEITRYEIRSIKIWPVLLLLLLLVVVLLCFFFFFFLGGGWRRYFRFCC